VMNVSFSSTYLRFLIGNYNFVLAIVSLNDLHQFDLLTLRWRQISGDVDGLAPSSRYNFGFAALGNSLYVFGGTAGTAGTSIISRTAV
jgi:hypothetical protein